MKSLFSLRSGFTVLALMLALTFTALTALGQSACLENCLVQLNHCLTQREPEGNCEDAYDACVESCLSEG